MRVCDRHPDRRAAETVHVLMDDQKFDLCPECKTEVLMLLASHPPEKLNGARRGRPPKESATAETTAP